MTEDWRAVAKTLDRDELERRYAICAEGWATCGLQRARLREVLQEFVADWDYMPSDYEGLRKGIQETSALIERAKALLAQPGEAA